MDGKPAAPAKDPKDGQFVRADGGNKAKDAKKEPEPEPVADPELPLEEDPTADAVQADPEGGPKDGEADPDAPAKEGDAPALETIVLPGLKERGEADEEIDVPAELAGRIRRMVNDGMRKRDYDDAIGKVRATEAELSTRQALIEQHPVAFLMQHLPKERRGEVAEAFLVEHWEGLIPRIRELALDPEKVYKAREQQRDTLRDGERGMEETRSGVERANEILSVARSLVPEGAEDEVIESFMRDAENDLAMAYESGKTLTKDTVASLLEKRVKLYGFSQKKADVKRPVVVRRPVTVDAAKQEQQRIKDNATRQATTIPAARRGAVVTRRPLIPKGADVEQASEALSGAKTWADFRPNST